MTNNIANPAHPGDFTTLVYQMFNGEEYSNRNASGLIGAVMKTLITSNERKVTLGEQFIIRLPLDFSHGLSWIIRKIPEQVAIFGQNIEHNNVNVGGKTKGTKHVVVLYLKAISLGVGDIELQCAPVWKDLPDEVETIRVCVRDRL